MNLSETKFLAKPFSHIYVEDDAFNYPLSKEILGRLKGSHIIKIKHYKDIFNRAGQDFLLQNLFQTETTMPVSGYHTG